MVRHIVLAVFILAARVLAADCPPQDDREALARYENVFFAIVDGYDFSGPSGRVSLSLTFPIVVKGTALPQVSVVAKKTPPHNYYLFFTPADGVVPECSPSRSLASADVAETWASLRGSPAPRLPLAAVASNFCNIRTGAGSTGLRRSVTIFDDGSVVLEGFGPKTAKPIRKRTLERIRAMMGEYARAREWAGWLSYIPSGLQELTLHFDDGVGWKSIPSYSRCGPMAGHADGYLTPRSDALVRAILAATGQKRAFDDCSCVKHP